MITNLKKSKKRSWATVFFSIVLVFLSIGTIGFLVFTNWKISQKRADLQEKIKTYEREIQSLQEKISSLQAGISQTQSQDYQLKKLYEQGYFEKGSKPVVVLPPEKKKEERVLEPKNIWQKFLESLGF